jgi:hypothetical protein
MVWFKKENPPLKESKIVMETVVTLVRDESNYVFYIAGTVNDEPKHVIGRVGELYSRYIDPSVAGLELQKIVSEMANNSKHPLWAKILEKAE